MPEFPRRTDGTRWWNDKPINDIHEALYLLQRDNSSTDPMHIHRSCEDGEVFWEIQEPWYREGSSGADSSGTNYFQIDQNIVQLLRADGLVQERKIPRWGYTDTRENELVISGIGNARLKLFHAEMLKKAKGMLVIGVHTDLSGEIRDRGYARDHTWYGNLYFLFDLPDEGGECRVYPELDKIVMPDEAGQSA